jgi:hypothetical protein
MEFGSLDNDGAVGVRQSINLSFRVIGPLKERLLIGSY